MSEYLELDRKKPIYYYIVKEFVTTFGKDPGRNDSFSHTNEFKNDIILNAKLAATAFYYERLSGLESGKYFLPFERPDRFVLGENSAFTILLALVEYYSEDNFIEHILLGEDDSTTEESVKIENAVLSENV